MPRAQKALALAACSLAALALHGCGGGGGGGDPCDYKGATDMATKSAAWAPWYSTIQVYGPMRVGVHIDSSATNITATVSAQANVVEGVYFTKAPGQKCGVLVSSQCSSDRTTVNFTIPDSLFSLQAHDAIVTVPQLFGDVSASEGASVAIERWGSGGKTNTLAAAGGSEVVVTKAEDFGANGVSISLSNSSQLHIRNGTGKIALMEMQLWSGSVANVTAYAARLNLQSRNGSMTISHVDEAYLKVSASAEVHIPQADKKVVECTTGRVMDIHGKAKILTPSKAKAEKYCSQSVTV